MTGARRVARHEAAHALLAEHAGVPIARIWLEYSSGRVRGFARLEPGYHWPAWAMFAHAGRSDVTRESAADMAIAHAAAAAATMPGRTVWEARHAPGFDGQLVTWRNAASQILDRHSQAVDALGHELVRHGRLNGDAVREVLRRNGAPVTR